MKTLFHSRIVRGLGVLMTVCLFATAVSAEHNYAPRTYSPRLLEPGEAALTEAYRTVKKAVYLPIPMARQAAVIASEQLKAALPLIRNPASQYPVHEALNQLYRVTAGDCGPSLVYARKKVSAAIRLERQVCGVDAYVPRQHGLQPGPFQGREPSYSHGGPRRGEHYSPISLANKWGQVRYGY